MAEDLKASAVEAPAVAPLEGGAGGASRSSSSGVPHALRFRLVYFALAILLGAAVGTTVLLLGSRSGADANWSTWKPTASGEARHLQIAEFVSSRYRHPSGRPLVNVITGPLTAQLTGAEGESQDVPIEAILVRGRTSDFSDAQVSRVSQDESLMFVLCGGGRNCTMDEGRPDRERGRLLRREILELALYAYHYDSDLKSIVAFLPPIRVQLENGQATDLQRAVWLRRDDVKQQLKMPLKSTLPSRSGARVPPQEAQTVDRLIVPRLYGYSVERAPQGDAVLVLSSLAS